MCVWEPERQERVLSGQNPSLRDCPIIPSHFLLHFPLSSFLSLPHSICFLFLPFFFWTHLPPLDTALLSYVTFPLICPLSCKGNQPRCSLISGQSYPRLLSQLRLIAAMLMTHRMGSWAPECCQQRWSPLCSLKPMLQIRPGEERRIILLVKVVPMNTYCKLHRKKYLHSFITVMNETTKPNTKSRANKNNNIFLLHTANLL